MANLRLLNYRVIDSANISFSFTENLYSTVGAANVSIVSQSYGVPDPTILSTKITDNVLQITTTPLTPFGIYIATLASTQLSIFKSINGSVLFEDGKTNVVIFSGAYNPDNNVLENLLLYYRKTPYNTETGTIIRDYLNAISDSLYKTQNTIGQVATDNYLSITVEDELHTRGTGPYDRLNNEGVYEIIRVGQYAKDVLFDGTLTRNPFPNLPITLQTKFAYNEQLVVGNDDSPGTFNGMICNLQNNNITKITQVRIIYAATPMVIYNLNAYGYQLKDARYDMNASTYVLLEANQFKFSDKSLQSGFVPPVSGDIVIVTYEYKDLGVYVDPSSIEIYEIKRSVREVCPPIANVFSLKHANLVNSSGAAVALAGVTFYDPKAIPPYSATHPAFKTEMVFSANSLPAAIGCYSVDYTNGKVYVYGEDTTKENTGSGQFPPVCTYYYKNSFVNGVDYTYEPNLLEIATNSERDMVGLNCVIEYQYSQNFVPGVDYEPQIHIEELSERIENRLTNVNIIETVHQPITNVFRIFNETTGEVYRVNRFTDSKITFNFNKPPTILNNKEERVTFEQIIEEALLYSEITTNVYAAIIWKIYLNNSNIISATEDCVASSINTSAQFSNTTVFNEEQYYDRELALSNNLNKLTSIGDFLVDYDNGIIYLRVASTQSPDIGTISYKSKYIQTNQDHILSVNSVYTRVDINSDKVSYQYNTFTDNKVDLLTYEISDVRYVSTDPDVPITVSSSTINLPQNAKAVRGVYEVNDINVTVPPINFAIGSSVNFSVATLVPVEYTQNSVISGINSVVVSTVLSNPDFIMNSVVYVKRISDGYELYNTILADGSFSGSTITLPTDTLGIAGDIVEVQITMSLNDGAAVIADIDLGGLFIDYTFLYDEIIVSYEYGDNVLDFRNSTTVEQNTQYYASYKYGALRDSLFANFGSIINIDDFKNFDVDFERERYRDALVACLQNYPKGPTKEAISNIAEIISHVNPIINESMYDEWVLGTSRLFDGYLEASGTLLPSIWDYGMYFVNVNDKLEVPFGNHIKLNNGTTEFWVNPNWDGIDNDAQITLSIYRDGYLLPENNIWIGAAAEHPTIENGEFTITRFDAASPVGIPYNIKDDGYGVFIYYDTTNKKWNVIAKDTP